MIFDIDKRDPELLVSIDDSGQQITNAELCQFSEMFSKVISKRTLIFILSENTIGSFAGYVACLSSQVVPLILSSNTDSALINNLVEMYQPEYLWLPLKNAGDFKGDKVFEEFQYVLIKTNIEGFLLNPELALLLPTSGSTGSPKLVRHSYSNISSNAKNVANFFEAEENDRPIAILPMHYTMGLSVITSYLYAGATLLIVKSALTDKSFWEFIKEQKATVFTGVPYSFEVIFRLRVFRMKLPDLKIFTQGGGKLSDEIFKAFAEHAEETNKKFIATYGQTEGTARMAYLPADMAVKKIGSIGKAIPNGRLSLVDDNGREIEEMEAIGQMVYQGSNVTLGYALSGVDLLKGDENNGILYTGDIAKRDADGFYYIVGRMKRFLKIYGFRISLDELENIIKSKYNIDCVCTGNDEHLRILITHKDLQEDVKNLIVEKTGLFHMAVNVSVVDEIPKNEAGKTIY